ncbi:unnamed protein product [Orchesella dallaii]|uniref:Uncharacterized protein n=1 Tax=Orchesella dallaii TaxID=48710 RepID=A0ABP1QSB3_9HEXA
MTRSPEKRLIANVALACDEVNQLKVDRVWGREALERNERASNYNFLISSHFSQDVHRALSSDIIHLINFSLVVKLNLPIYKKKDLSASDVMKKKKRVV